ncbi:ring-opening amidohydrolase [uncultured Alsobacter sp.]|uniref:cyanuric acid amidohydrolase n=1 Tax=uncultured Alsobacter sp. TaxID=1748258 RepID=UPI0025F14F51|nr:ring-opening amidohydrolase [uncultured Alsobacter sp.]
MATRRAFVHRVPMGAPDDVSALQAAMAQGRIDPAAIVAILGKTEGNGCVNDFTRGFASMVLARTLAAASPATADGVCLVMSGGTEGGLSPHATVIESRATDEPAEAGALAVGRARTRPLPAEHLGRREQVDSVADGVRTAMADAGIADPRDVHFVQVKCPLLTAGRVAEAEARGQRTATRDTLKSMGLSRAASALGVGLALDEIPLTTAFDTVIGTDFSVYSGRASTSAGVELAEHEIVVLGTAPGWAGPLRIDHAVMADGLDVEPVRAALARLGLEAAGQLDPHQRGRLVALLAKAEAGSTGRLRGFRHTMLDDSDLSATRHARGFVAGALGSLVGHAEIYVSGGAEHQGPDGGGPVALIVSSR